MKKVILIGSTGIIGKHILQALRQYDHLEVITVSRNQGSDIQADISALADIRRMYAAAGTFDAVISAAGHCHIGPFDQMTEEDMYVGIRNKMMDRSISSWPAKT